MTEGDLLPRCRRCGDVIGVYEPLVTFEKSHPRTTSRAAEPGLDTAGVYYHRRCFAERKNGTPPQTGG
jgi:hypothetical protein